MEEILVVVGRSVSQFQNSIGTRICTCIDNAVRQISRAIGDEAARNGVVARINDSLII